jgi:uncharacterized protein (TIGR03000 family)
MFRKAFLFGGLLLLTGAVVLATPGPGQAQHGGGHGGGGHAGGGHFGGAHFGGGHFGGYRGGFYHGGAYYGGYHYGYPYAHYGYRHYYPYYGGYGGYYPYYYGSYGDDYAYDTYPYAWSGPTYDSGYSSSYGDVAPYYGDGTASAAPPAGSYQSFYPPATATAPSDRSAHVTVNVPADARLWFDDTATTATGPVRQFDSPPLTPGTRYSYEVRAGWTENGREVTQTQKVAVTAGAHVRVDFPVPSGTAGQGSSTNER